MKIEIDSNGWTIHITNLDPRNINEQEIIYLKTLPYTNIIVAIHDVPILTTEEYRTFCHKVFDKVQNDSTVHEKRILEGSRREIIRVTGKRNENGEVIGVFGMPELLNWHCNQPGLSLNVRPDCLTLYSVSGCEGSVTAYTNGVLALADLRNTTDSPPGLLKNLDKIEIEYNFTTDLDLASENHNYRGVIGRNKLVSKNKAGLEGLMFSNVQSHSFYINNNKVPDKIFDVWFKYLQNFCTQKKYVYEHHWKNNEITMNCQVLSQHARYPFEKISERYLWRVMGSVNNFNSSLQSDFDIYQ